MRPVFCGNFDFDARASEVERLFRKYGKVERVDMKSGFAFIYMEDERDARDAVRGLDQIEFGQKGRRLRVEWTKHERGGGRSSGSRRSANMRPSKTLFVINFDTYNTKTRDLEKHFEPYGKIASVRIRRNFAFVQYEYQEDAAKALDATHMSKLMDQVISVEYAARDDDERKGGYSPRGRSPDRGDTRRRSPSPYRRERGSPDYGRGPSPFKRERGSPDYGCDASPAPKHRVRGSRSPAQRERDVRDQNRSRSRSRNRSSYGRENRRVGNYSDADGSPYGKRGPEPESYCDYSPNPNGEAREKRGSPVYERERSFSPAAED